MYLPILKNRSVEVDVLRNLVNLGLTQTYPMLELVQQKVRTNARQDYVDEVAELLDQTESFTMFVDIPKMNVPQNVPQPIREFLVNANRNPQFSLDILLRLKGVNGVIPVVSYNPRGLNVTDIVTQANLLRKSFNTLAFRVESSTFDQAFVSISTLIRPGDYLIFDIGSASHINPWLKPIYSRIAKEKKNIGFTSIIINSPRTKEVTNLGLEDGKPILTIDNSLRDYYKTHHFDGFGDYAGITDDLPTGGGSISPAGVYYSYQDNVFIGFRRNKVLSEFEDYIAPQIVHSPYWKEYSDTHHNNCPGCHSIAQIVRGKESGKSQAKWKGITMAHYIYSIDENLKP